MSYPLFQGISLAVATVLLAGCSQEQGMPDEPRPLENPEVHQAHNSISKLWNEPIVLKPGERTEVKAVLPKHQAILYEWYVEGGPVYSDFHGHDPADDSFWVRYREDLSAIRGAGSLVSPLDGEHGWYFRNDNQGEIVIYLRINGFFDRIENYGIFPEPEAQPES